MRDTTTNSQPVRLGPIGEYVFGREVTVFFALTLALSWAMWVPGAIGLVDFGPLVTGVIIVGGFGPLVAAAIVTWLVGDSLRAWAGQALRWRVRPRWYLAAVGLPPAVVAAITVVYVALGNPLEVPVAIQQVPLYAVPLIHVLSMVSVFFVGGGQEELGWRGYALPRLLERFDAVTASLVIGAVWAVWHLPLFVVEGSGQYGGPFVPYTITILALSILFTWLYLGTGRSVLLAMILHASYNSTTVFLPGQTPTDAMRWMFAAVVWVFALGLVVKFGRGLGSGTPDDRELAAVPTPPDT